jgi:hypothetical protein
MRNQKRLAAAGLLLTLPALAVSLSGIFKFSVPLSLIHPALVIGGLLGALALNLFPIASAHTHLENGNLVGALSIKLRGTLINLGVAFLSLALLGLIALYVFVENFQPR